MISTRWRESGSAARPASCRTDRCTPTLIAHTMVQLDFLAVLEQWPALLRGAAFTLGLSAVAAVVGVGLGIACAWTRAYGPRPLAAVAAVYVELVRNTPFIVQLFFIFFGLPSLGVKLTPEIASIIAMAR